MNGIKMLESEKWIDWLNDKISLWIMLNNNLNYFDDWWISKSCFFCFGLKNEKLWEMLVVIDINMSK